MGFKKLAGIALVSLFAVSSAIAQPLTQFNKDSRNITAEELEKTRTTTHTMEAKQVEGTGHDLSPTGVFDGRGFESNPLVLTRSFREALKENSDREMMERLVK